MRTKRTPAYAIGGVSAAIAAIVITASTAGLGPASSEGAREQPATAPALMPGASTALVTVYEDDGGGYERDWDDDDDDRHEGHEHEDDDDD